jgi:hypothetical protein
MRGFKMTAGAPVSVGKFLVVQMTPDAAEQFKQAVDEGDIFDLTVCDVDEVKIVAEFDGIGQGVIV